VFNTATHVVLSRHMLLADVYHLGTLSFISSTLFQPTLATGIHQPIIRVKFGCCLGLGEGVALVREWSLGDKNAAVRHP
jgi:hypothetical protein